ncbi:MAG: hypothetical protein JFAIHJKO_01928 [Pyrinomonadaceae bacterium]|nr:hypothetical protein [Pyrinomonadaceae bacterium]
MAAAFLSAAIDVLGQKKPKKPRKSARRPVITMMGDPVSSVPKPEPLSENVTAFLQAWSVVNETYFDSTFAGLDWDKVREEYLPRAKAAKSEAEIDNLILEMVGKLGKSHFGIVPASFFRSLKVARKLSAEHEGALAEPATSNGAGEKRAGISTEFELDDDDQPEPGKFGIGIELRALDGQFMIVSVLPGSSAAAAGIKPGYILDEINGISLKVLSETITKGAPNVRHLDRMLPTAIKMWLLDRNYALNVKITCLDADDRKVEYDLERKPLNGHMISLGGLTPNILLEYRSDSLNDDVGYVKFNVFGLQVLGHFCETIREFSKKKAVIIDLRGNLGGLVHAARGFSGMLEPGPVLFGTSVARGVRTEIDTDDKAKKFKGRVIVLVDDQSMSAAELVSAELQDNARAVIIGQRTAGEALPAMSMKLATGSVMSYPVADLLRPEGVSVEARGVDPDIAVRITRKDLLSGPDPALAKALEIIGTDVYQEEIAKREAAKERRLAAKKAEADLPPPPPKAISGTNFGTGSGKPNDLARATRPKAEKPSKDQKAEELLSNAAKLVGDLSKIKTYSFEGTLLLTFGGTPTKYKYSFYRELPDKYVSTSVSDLMGTLRSGAVGKDTFFESNVGLSPTNVVAGDDPNVDLYARLRSVLAPDAFSSLKYDGVYDADGKSLSIIEGTDKEARTIYITLDKATGLPFRIYDGTIAMVFDDYRKEGGFMLPRRIKVGAALEFLISNYTIGQKFDPSVFEKRESCFDRP